jgi:hypothetical protein
MNELFQPAKKIDMGNFGASIPSGGGALEAKIPANGFVLFVIQ